MLLILLFTLCYSELNIAEGLFNDWYDVHHKFLNEINERFNLKREDHLKQFIKNFKYVNSFNLLNEDYKLSWKGPFTSLNETILNKLFKRINNEQSYVINDKKSDKPIPDQVDYRNFYNSVRDQGSCASCYSFGSVGAIEGRLNKKYNKFFDLSEQEIVSCSSNYGNKGCGGGMSYNVYEYIKNNNLTFESELPYCACDESCIKVKKYVKIKNYQSVKNNMAEAIYRGPIDIAMNVVSSFSLYSSGYYNEKNCQTSFNSLNHEMVAVGYGYNNGKLYYIIRNSWGPYWGINGYAYVYEGICGVDTDPVEPIDPDLI